MGDDSSEDPACTNPVERRETEHQRRNQLQAELLRKAYDRSRHAAFINAMLRRTRSDQDADECNQAEGV
jgi:hypothetical protein